MSDPLPLLQGKYIICVKVNKAKHQHIFCAELSHKAKEDENIMDPVKCEVMIKALELGSISAAAEVLGYTPSGVNRMMNALEAECGLTLLARGRGGVTLTSEGEKILPVMRELVRWNETAQQVSADIRGLTCGRLTVGTLYSIAACRLPGIIRMFSGAYPDITIDIREGGRSQMEAWLKHREADICFMSGDTNEGCWTPLYDDEMVVWLPKDHPLAGRKRFPVSALAKEKIIKIMPGSGTNAEELYAEAGVTPDVIYTTADNYTAYSMVAAGLGVCVNNALMAKKWQGDVTVLPFAPAYKISIGIASPPPGEISPAAQKFIEFAVKEITVA